MSEGVFLIISASRRTDIPAFYAQWFINRIRAGHCTVPNPFNRKQVSHVLLHPGNVDVIVFWTRNPQSLVPYLKELDRLGYRYYFQYTVMNNPRLIDAKVPSLSSSLEVFKKLSGLIGPERVIWRYDPVIISNITDIEFHTNTYKNIAETLRNYTKRSVISILDIYPKLKKRLKVLKDIGVYDTCVFDCQYCYATSSFEKAEALYRNHNPESTSIVDYGD